MSSLTCAVLGLAGARLIIFRALPHLHAPLEGIFLAAQVVLSLEEAAEHLAAAGAVRCPLPHLLGLPLVMVPFGGDVREPNKGVALGPCSALFGSRPIPYSSWVAVAAHVSIRSLEAHLAGKCVPYAVGWPVVPSPRCSRALAQKY